MDDVERQVTDLVQSLHTDRLINLTVGAGTKGIFKVQIQQKLLEAASEWFAKALKHDAFIEGKAGKIDFPEDDCKAWEILIYWIVKRTFIITIRSFDDVVLVTKCWVIGDKYDIKAFQDEAMMALLRAFDRLGLYQAEELGATLKLCPPDSKLARLFGEELAASLRTSRLRWEQVHDLDLGHLWKDVSKAQLAYSDDIEWRWGDRLGGPNGERMDHRPYKTMYMVDTDDK